MSKPTPEHPLIPFHHSKETQAGLIYGVVTALAVIAVLASSSTSILLIDAAVIGTAFALAVTFIYSHWLAGSYSDSDGHGDLRKAIRREAPTLVGPLLLSAVMLLMRLAGTGTSAAANTAMWIGVAFLFVLGYRIALQSRRSYHVAIGFGVLDAMVGASIVLIKVLVH